jgi:hypothetical protein
LTLMRIRLFNLMPIWIWLPKIIRTHALNNDNVGIFLCLCLPDMRGYISLYGTSGNGSEMSVQRPNS